MFAHMEIPPLSCDSFAVLPPGTHGDCVIFGKNSDRPWDEVQEVVYIPASDHPQSSKVKCTYIEVNQVPHTYAVVLSKPSCVWGAEMGANEYGLCIGHEAVWTMLYDQNDSTEKLLGMDLLRLGLERSKTAEEAVHIITSLLAEYGVGGNCSENLDHFTYDNSFLIADPSEVWILECAGTLWAAEKIKEGVRNLSNELSIRTKIDLKSNDLEKIAIEKGLWNPKWAFDFKRVFVRHDGPEGTRSKAGKELLINYSQTGEFKATDMFKVLRDKPSGICISSGTFITTGSQVSVLHKPESGLPSCHWFTATPDPARSIFKPFIFGEDITFPSAVVSDAPDTAEDIYRRHKLYKLHEDFCIRQTISLRKQLSELETKYVSLAEDISLNYSAKKADAGKLFYNAVEEESHFYS